MTMRAILVQDDELVLGHAPAPPCGPDDVRIRTVATAVNRADLHQRAGRYPPPPGASPILGLECAGVIETVGANVHHLAPGDRVAALLAGGGYAEQVVCPAGHVLPVPNGMDWHTAAALPEALSTAFLNLIVEGSLQPGDRVLLHAGASGVGTTALQLLRVWGHRVWVTAGSAQKIDACRRLGAEGGTVRGQASWLEDVRQWSDGQGVDVILDPVGASYLADNQQALAKRGRLVVIGLLGGRSADLDLGRLLVQRQHIIGSVLRSRSDSEKAALISRILKVAWPLCLDGRVQPVIDSVFPLQEAEQAHRRVASNQTIGKVVLTVD
jgi:putative PIG3 family NAD(P)H quinone oxidoreductase